MTPLLRLDKIACARGGRLLVRQLSFVLEPGAAIRLDGPNGTGKSSLLRLSAGLLRPLSGQVERPARCALVDDRPGFAADHHVEREIAWWVGETSVRPALDAMGIAHLADIPIRHLSLGQIRRAALARAIAGGEPLWLLDEPSASLDADGRERLDTAVAAHRAAGGAVVVADHRPPGWPGLRTLSLAAYEPEPAVV